MATLTSQGTGLQSNEVRPQGPWVAMPPNAFRCDRTGAPRSAIPRAHTTTTTHTVLHNVRHSSTGASPAPPPPPQRSNGPVDEGEGGGGIKGRWAGGRLRAGSTIGLPLPAPHIPRTPPHPCTSPQPPDMGVGQCSSPTAFGGHNALRGLGADLSDPWQGHNACSVTFEGVARTRTKSVGPCLPRWAPPPPRLERSGSGASPAFTEAFGRHTNRRVHWHSPFPLGNTSNRAFQHRNQRRHRAKRCTGLC